MTWAMWAAPIFVILVLTELIRMNLLLFRTLKSEQKLEPSNPGSPPENLPSVSVVIPAKDEEAHIESCIRSVMASDYKNLQIVVVDDRSRDRTQEIVRRLAQEVPRIEFLSIKDLPEGWTGKTHALFSGAQKATGELLLFSDADTTLHPSAISRAVRHMMRHRVDMLSLLPQFQDRGFIENAVYPHLALGLSSLYPLAAVNDPESPCALASGCFITISKQAYEDLGTWKRFRSEITEDIGMSKAAKASNFRLHVIRGGELVRTKPFDRLSDVCQFWKRTFYGGLEKSVPKILRLILNYTVLTLLFILQAAALAALLWGHHSLPVAMLTGISTIAVLLVVIPYGFVVYAEGGSWWYGLTAPIGIVVSAWVAFTAMFAILSGKGVRWRGSLYS